MTRKQEVDYFVYNDDSCILLLALDELRMFQNKIIARNSKSGESPKIKLD